MSFVVGQKVKVVAVPDAYEAVTAFPVVGDTGTVSGIVDDEHLWVTIDGKDCPFHNAEEPVEVHGAWPLYSDEVAAA